MLRLISIPHAGGSAASLAPLRRYLSHALDFRPVELPGRGARHREALHTDRQALVRQLSTEIAPETARPYALFGHSLGAMLSYELAHALIASGCRAPSMLFVAAAAAPSTWQGRFSDRPLSDAELKATLEQRGGTPPELFQHPELLELFMPVLRADFQLCGGATPEPLAPLPCPVHVAAGLRDQLSIAELAAWRFVTDHEFSVSWYEGDHFFVRSHAAQLCASIVQRLAALELVPITVLQQSCAT